MWWPFCLFLSGLSFLFPDMLTQIVTYLYEDEWNLLEKSVSKHSIERGRSQSILWQVKTPSISVTLYRTGKLLVQGEETEEFLHTHLEDIVAARYTVTSIGTDESGKGDYFGPLVVAAARIGRFDVEFLLRNSVQDSKSMSDAAVVEVAEKIAEVIPHKVVVIGNQRYNELHQKTGNVNRLLVWAHAKAAEELFQESVPQRLIVDRFANPVHLKTRLKEYKNLDLVQVERGERELPVATASILARAGFLSRLKSISKRYGFEFPKGAGEEVVEAAREFIRKFGEERLGEVAKLHFKTTQKIRARDEPTG
ncbi:MAG: ribonuclease HIII [Planctomycetota bacterium]|nr:ribonuclease HIII [Planctomycetota bacterium]